MLMNFLGSYLWRGAAELTARKPAGALVELTWESIYWAGVQGKSPSELPGKLPMEEVAELPAEKLAGAP